MWNLNGNDIKKAKDELEARRATLTSKYEEEMKQIDAELADIETVERVAVNFVSHRNGDSPQGDAAPEKDEPSGFDAAEMKSSSDSDNHSESHDKPAAEQKGSRWRMRLGTMSETEAAD